MASGDETDDESRRVNRVERETHAACPERRFGSSAARWLADRLFREIANNF